MDWQDEDYKKVRQIAREEITSAMTPLQAQIASVGANLLALFNPNYPHLGGIPGYLQTARRQDEEKIAEIQKLQLDKLERLGRLEQIERDKMAAAAKDKEDSALEAAAKKEADASAEKKNAKRWKIGMWAVGVIVSLLIAVLSQEGCKKKMSGLLPAPGVQSSQQHQQQNAKE